MQSCRENKSVEGRVDRSRVVGEGSFKRVYRGTYVEGERQGQPQATKEIINTTPHTANVFQYDIVVAKAAAQVVEAWNAASFTDTRVLVTIPEVWAYTGDSDVSGVAHLVEPFLENYEKFNSNTGWVPAKQRRWTELMQALSHFSYHASRRCIVLCDLQGAVRCNCIVLTDPAILSQDGRYGPTDMGAKGIATFFHHHKCNRFCRPEWRRPGHTVAEFPLRYGTSMVRPDGAWLVPIRETKPPMAATEAMCTDAGAGGVSARAGLLRWCRRRRAEVAAAGALRRKLPGM